MAIENTGSLVKSIARLGSEKEVSFLAGSIAFFAFVSLIPAVVLVMAVGSLVGGEAFAERIVGLLESALSDEGAEILQTALADTTGLAGASLVSLAVLFWSTLKVFRAIDIAFNRIYPVDTVPSLPRQLLNGTVVVLAIGASLTVLILVRMILGWLDVPFMGLLTVALVLLGLVVLLTPMYYVMAPVSVSLRSVLPGAIVAVIGLVLLQQLFGIYAGQADQYQAYGFIGAVLLFLLWLYFGATVLLLGVVVNAALLGEQTAVKPHDASSSALPVTPEFDEFDIEAETAHREGQRADSNEASEDEPPLRPQ